MLLAENPEVLGEMGVEGLEMPLDGFLYIYVNNESAHDVQFDNLRIRYNPGQLLQVNHYYPYGLPIKELSTQPSKGKPYNDYLMTTKEWNTEFGLNEYDFGARSYDPAIARWYVQDPAEQFYNPYLAIGNNPVVYYDPDGEFVHIVIGAIIGAYMGGVAANGTYDFTKWDSKDTWSYMIGGAVIGGASGFLGGHIASSGGIFANTSAIAAGSFTNSLGMNMLTGGKTDVNFSLGFGSLNLSNGSFGHLGKKGNSTLENIEYGLGALTNISDGVGLFDQIRAKNRMNLTDAEKQVQYENNFKKGWYDEYLGPNGNADPTVARANEHIPKTLLGEATYQHDVSYYNQGADGLRGALFNTKTVAADRALISSTRNIRQSFRGGADIELDTYRWAGKVRATFITLVGFKYTITNSYLFTPLTITR